MLYQSRFSRQTEQTDTCECVGAGVERERNKEREK